MTAVAGAASTSTGDATFNGTVYRAVVRAEVQLAHDCACAAG